MRPSDAGLSQQVLELNARVGLRVAILDNDGGVDGKSPVLAHALSNSAGAGDDDCIFRNDEWLFVCGLVDGAAHNVINGRGAVQDNAGAEYGAAFDHRAFVDAGVAAHQDVVFDDDGHSAHGFQYAADLRGRRDVAIG